MNTGKAINFRFKPSPLGPVPEDWEVVRLGENKFFSLVMGQSPPSSTYNEEGIGLPFLQGCAEFGKMFPKPVMYCSSPIKVAKPGDILISVRAPVGEINLVKTEICIGRGLAALRPNLELSETQYVFYTLQRFRRRLQIRSSGSTFKAITKTDLESFPIPLPPLPEQKRIAEVLRTVDEAIEKVEEEIEHTERLKRGLMQHLLTRGIGHARFKDTPIGKIPEKWEVVRLGDIGVIVTGKTPSTKIQKFWNGEIMFVTPTDYRGRKYINDTERYITKEGAAQAVLIPPNSVLVVCIASIGEIAINSDYCVTNQQINSIIPGDKVDTEFLYYVLKFRSKILKLWAGITTTPIVKKSLFEKFQIPLPPLPEQRKIAEILMTVDRKLELLRQKKEHLERIKKGLMNDLLTGRRRLKYE